MTPELSERLGLEDPDVIRARMLSEAQSDKSHLGVYLLGAYVVDDTDLWGDGEIYWWSIPALVRRDGTVHRNPLHGVPMGQPPHKVGSLEWMTSFSLAEPPLLATIPPIDDVQSCVLRIAFYDDDGAAADLNKALTAALDTYWGLGDAPLTGAEQIITPVRNAIWTSLKGDEDDILVDQDVIIRRGEALYFGSGMIASLVNGMVRIYYLVRDEARTLQFGPVALHKGQVETVKFDQPMRGSGKLAMFARGADVSCSAFGDLGTERPFINKIIESRQAGGLEQGFSITGTGPAKFVAYYTP
jgi:hypothetical protein